MGRTDDDDDATGRTAAAPHGQGLCTLRRAAFAGGNRDDGIRRNTKPREHVNRTVVARDPAPLELLLGDCRPRHQDRDPRHEAIPKEIADLDLPAVAAFGRQHREVGWRQRITRRHRPAETGQDRGASGAADQQYHLRQPKIAYTGDTMTGEGSTFPMLTPELLDDVVQRILDVGSPRRIVLFGSRARGDARRNSDLDLLIIEDSELPRYRRPPRYLRALVGVFPAKDIVVWTPAEVDAWRDVPNAFITSVLRDGRTLYER